MMKYCANKSNKTKPAELPGFTILETLITLVVTSLVIALTFSYFNALQRYMQKNMQLSDYETTFFRFESLLAYDFDRCSKAFIQPSGTLIFNLGNAKIQYKLEPDFILRNDNGKVDTLFVNSLDYETVPARKRGNDIEGLILYLTDGLNNERSMHFLKLYPVKYRFESFLESNK